MENRLVTTKEMIEHKDPLADNVHVVAFKLVSFGPNTLAEAGRDGAKLCEIADQQPSFFIISESPDGLRQGMHDLVDRLCNLREKQNEST
jgi:hypothetical protein